MHRFRGPQPGDDLARATELAAGLRRELDDCQQELTKWRKKEADIGEKLGMAEALVASLSSRANSRFQAPHHYTAGAGPSSTHTPPPDRPPLDIPSSRGRARSPPRDRGGRYEEDRHWRERNLRPEGGGHDRSRGGAWGGGERGYDRGGRIIEPEASVNVQRWEREGRGAKRPKREPVDDHPPEEPPPPSRRPHRAPSPPQPSSRREPIVDPSPPPPPPRRPRQDLVPLVGKSARGGGLRQKESHYFKSNHHRKARCLGFNPADPSMFVESALDGLLNFWEMTEDGTDANLRICINARLDGQHGWPEHIVFDPRGELTVVAYQTPPNMGQVGIIRSERRNTLALCDARPHATGVNVAAFLTTPGGSFVTGGNDHAIFLWSDGGKKTTLVHRTLHTSAVMGVVPRGHRGVVASVGRDKRLLGWDLEGGRTAWTTLLNSEAVALEGNPVDDNMLLVQCSEKGKQFRLFDVRQPTRTVHTMGWEQLEKASLSAQIGACWSPCGKFFSSGSTDPRIYVFDIRHSSQSAVLSMQAHTKRVLRAAWHPTLPLLISISSDDTLGMHRLRHLQ